MSGGGRHVARREDDKCASYGSLFIGQSSGTQVETEGKHDGFEPGNICSRTYVTAANSSATFIPSLALTSRTLASYLDRVGELRWRAGRSMHSSPASDGKRVFRPPVSSSGKMQSKLPEW